MLGIAWSTTLLNHFVALLKHHAPLDGNEPNSVSVKQVTSLMQIRDQKHAILGRQ